MAKRGMQKLYADALIEWAESLGWKRTPSPEAAQHEYCRLYDSITGGRVAIFYKRANGTISTYAEGDELWDSYIKYMQLARRIDAKD